MTSDTWVIIGVLTFFFVAAQIIAATYDRARNCPREKEEAKWPR